MDDAASEHRRELQRLRGRLSRMAAALRASEDIAEDATRRLHAKVGELTRLNAIAERAKLEADEQRDTMLRFIAIISHEIRTPLNTVIGLAYLASHLDLPPPGARYVLDIHSAGKHLLELVNRVLDFSALRAGKITLEPSMFQLGTVIERLAAMLESRVAGKPVQLVFDVADDVPAWLVGDPVRLLQVLLNFLYNAVKFTDDGFIELSVRVASRSGSRLVLAFAIRDTGSGIPAGALERLFQEYEQGGAWVPRTDGGTGLGLAINREIIRLMDGEIDVDSVVGQGSVFSFTAVFEVVDEASSPPDSLGSRLGERTRRPYFQGARALLADANPAARRAICAMLRSFGLEVEVADNGPSAVRMFRDAVAQRRRIDLVFIDEAIPDIGGEVLSSTLRELEPPDNPCTHILLTSGYTSAGSSASAAARVDATLAKPVIASRLNDLLVTLAHGGTGRKISHTAPMLPVLPTVEDISDDERRALAGRRVLVVDDSVMNVLVAQGLLETVGCHVQSAPDGLGAIEAASNETYDVIIMDMNMPVMGGLEATKKIHETTINRHTPIIGCTASTLREDLAACRAAGMCAVLAKPYSPHELYRLILACSFPPSVDRGLEGPGTT